MSASSKRPTTGPLEDTWGSIPLAIADICFEPVLLLSPVHERSSETASDFTIDYANAPAAELLNASQELHGLRISDVFDSVESQGTVQRLALAFESARVQELALVASGDSSGQELTLRCQRSGGYLVAALRAQTEASLEPHREMPSFYRVDESKAQTTQVLARRYLEERDRAEAANRAKSAFLASISHELRTPLNAVLGFAEIIRDEMLGPVSNRRYIEYAADIYRSGGDLLELVKGIVDMSKIEAGQWKLVPAAVDIVPLIEECVLEVSERAASAEVMLAKQIGSLPTAWIDKRAFKQIILNLLSNGIKFTPPGGVVTIQARAEADSVTVTVRDTGVGIERLGVAGSGDWKPCARKRDDRPKSSGFGLALSRSLVDIHGGHLELESEVGAGTTVTFSLPRHPRNPRVESWAGTGHLGTEPKQDPQSDNTAASPIPPLHDRSPNSPV